MPTGRKRVGSEHFQYSYQRSFLVGSKVFGNAAVIYTNNGKSKNKISICIYALDWLGTHIND